MPVTLNTHPSFFTDYISVCDVISHLFVDDCVQSLQTRLAEGVATVQSPRKPLHQVVASETHNAHQILPPQWHHCLQGNRGWRRGKRLTGDFLLLIFFFSVIRHYDLIGREEKAIQIKPITESTSASETPDLHQNFSLFNEVFDLSRTLDNSAFWVNFKVWITVVPSDLWPLVVPGVQQLNPKPSGIRSYLL